MAVTLHLYHVIITKRVMFDDTKLTGYTLDRQTAILILCYWELRVFNYHAAITNLFSTTLTGHNFHYIST